MTNTGWQPIETAKAKKMALIYYPPTPKGGRMALPALVRVGYPVRWGNRRPTLWAEIPRLPE